MQTFLPYADFTASSVVLDDRRLGKQRVETFQILRALTWPDYAWKNHPAVRMWRGFVPALVAYGLTNCAEWVRRGNADTVEASLLTFTGGRRPDLDELRRSGQLPPWVGLPALHLSHRSALLRKDPGFYGPLFGGIPDDLPYLWPPDAFPRWPARLPAGVAPGPEGALQALGYDEPRPGQAEAVAAVGAGRDVLGCFAPRAGATSTALLAGLAVPGTTLWVSAHAGGGGALPPGGVELPAPRVRVTEASADAEPEADDRTDTAADADASDADASDADADEPTPAKTSTPIARPPTPVEVLAMTTEAEAVPDFRFHRPEELERPEVRADLERTPLSLIVVDLGVAEPGSSTDAHADAVRRLRAEVAAAGRVPPPLLVVGGAATADERAACIRHFGLREPQHVGGGFDPVRLRFGVVTVPDENRRRSALASLLVRGPRPGLVLAPDVEAARRLAKGLVDRGASAAPLLPVGRRSTTESAVAAWRRGTLRALVLPADQPFPGERLGRKDATFVHVSGPLPDRRRLLELLHAVPNRAASPAVLMLVTPAEQAAAEAADPTYADLFSGRACRRAALLDVVGEPVAVPCGRCDVCLSVPAEQLLLDAVTPAAASV